MTDDQQAQPTTFKVKPELVRFIAYLFFWTMCILAIILTNTRVSPLLLAGPPADTPETQLGCPPFDSPPGQGFDIKTNSHLIRAFGFNNICSNWDYSPSREITAMYYPCFEYTLLIYIFLNFLSVALHYRNGMVSRVFYLSFKISFPFLIIFSAWFRLIFVGIAYEKVAWHTFGFLTLQIVLIAVACFNVWFIVETGQEYKMFCGYTKYFAYAFLVGNLTISAIKIYLTAYVVTGNGYPTWANTTNPPGGEYPPGRIIDYIWMIFNAVIPLILSYVRSLNETPLQFTIDFAPPVLKPVGWNDGPEDAWENVEEAPAEELEMIAEKASSAEADA